MNNWIAVFKTGTHTDSAGNTRTWTEAELDTIAAKYQPSQHEAPAVIGHPEHNSPAWGWVEALKRDGQILYAKFKDLVPEFTDMVKNGLFKKRSISLYPDMTLRHVGFLGAMPPAVKGLPDVAFSSGLKGLTIEFTTDESYGKEAKSMKWLEWMKKKATDEGVTLEDMPVSFSAPAPAVDISAQVNAEVAKLVKAKELEFAEKLNVETQGLASLKAELAKKEEALKKTESERLKAEINAFCEGLCKEGKLTPAIRKQGMGLDVFMEKISGIQEGVEFAEGDKKVKQTPLEYIKALLGGAKTQIEFSEIASADKDIARGGAGDKLSAITKAKMKADKNLSYSQAFSEAQMENPQLAIEYAGEVMKK